MELIRRHFLQCSVFAELSDLSGFDLARTLVFLETG